MDYYNKTPSTKFWSSEGTFDKGIRDKLLAIATDFFESLELDGVEIQDIQLTGSMANYNYTADSDLDVHILIDFKDVDENVELVGKALSGSRFIWNIRHHIVMRGHEVELYVQDMHEPHVASGLYSILNDEWIKVPEYDKPEIDEQDINKKFNSIVRDLELIEEHLYNRDLDESDLKGLYERTKRLKDKVQKDRQEGLNDKGLYSVENMVFKKLRNEGHIEKMISLANQIYSDIYSEGFEELVFAFFSESAFSD